MSKPNINIPAEFAVNGIKTDFDNSKLLDGFDKLNPDVLAGDNLNKFIDDTYKGLNGVLELYEGCVLYDSTVTYTNKSLVFDITNDGIKFYHSLQNSNTGNSLSDNTYWEEIELGGANTDLSNLTATGKDYVVNLTNELDWDNAISVSTSTGTQTYTPTADGIMLLSAFSSGGSANKDVYAYFTLPSGHQVGNQILGTNSALWNTTYLYVKNNTQITYTLGLGNSSGTLHNEVKAIFIPFKKA